MGDLSVSVRRTRRASSVNTVNLNNLNLKILVYCLVLEGSTGIKLT